MGVTAITGATHITNTTSITLLCRREAGRGSTSEEPHTKNRHPEAPGFSTLLDENPFQWYSGGVVD